MQSDWQPARINLVHPKGPHSRGQGLSAEQLRQLQTIIVMARPVNMGDPGVLETITEYRADGCDAERFYSVRRDKMGMGLAVGCEHEVLTD